MIAESALGSTYHHHFRLAILARILPQIVAAKLALTVRRFHDTGKSGWNFLIRFIPVIGGIWYLVLVSTNGEYGSNKYGLDPKRPVDNEIDDIGVAEV